MAIFEYVELHLELLYVNCIPGAYGTDILRGKESIHMRWLRFLNKNRGCLLCTFVLSLSHTHVHRKYPLQISVFV